MKQESSSVEKFILKVLFCLALCVIAPGMSFSTLLMPLGLYEPFVTGFFSALKLDQFNQKYDR